MKSIPPPLTPPQAEGKQKTPQAEGTERAMSQLLRFGVLLSAAVVLIGGVLYLLQHGRAEEDYHLFSGERYGLRSIISAAFALDPRGIIQFGLLLLIVTPVARVLMALIMFLRERDKNFVWITLIVLVVLLYGFLGGKV